MLPKFVDYFHGPLLRCVRSVLCCN